MNEPSSGFDPVEELVDEFLERYRRGERPSLTEYTAHHPELAERIRASSPRCWSSRSSVLGVGSRASVRRLGPARAPRCHSAWAITCCSV